MDDAVEWTTRSRELAVDERWTAFRPWPEAWLAHVRLANGEDPSVVREAAEGTFALARQLQDPCWEGLAAKTIGLTHLADGEHATALEWMKNAGTLCRRITDSYLWIEVDAFLAEAQAALDFGDADRAEAVARRAVEVAAKGSMDDLMDRALRLLDSAT